jgi:hypothetical protein
MTQPESLFAWLDRYARRIEFQELPPSRARSKNRVIVEFVDANGRVDACGGATVYAAISKARARSITQQENR